MRDELVRFEPAIFDLIHGAGLKPMSYGSGSDGTWVVAFERDGKRVELTGRHKGGTGSVLWAQTEAVLAYLTSVGITLSPTAVELARLSSNVAWHAGAQERTAEAVRQLELSVSALRAARIDDGSIRVWRFSDAPPELRALSSHGGDEDWVALVPAGHDEPAWAQDGSPFGCCDVSRHDPLDGSFVLIGAHA